MEKVVFINSRGQEVELSNSAPFLLTKIDGTECTEAELQTSKAPYQDGISVDDVLLHERTLTLEGAIFGTSTEDLYEKRQYLSSIFNPKLKRATLVYTNNHWKKMIDCFSSHPPVFSEKVGTMQRFLVTLICPSPFWLDTDITCEEITTWIGGYEFPFEFPVEFASKGEKKKLIVNEGDVDTPIEVRFNGPALNPKITNLTTGEFIEIKRDLSSDDVLTINTDFGSKSVEIIRGNAVKENAFNYINLDSTFFKLQVGDNIIEYSSEGLEPSSVSIKYKNRYVGI